MASNKTPEMKVPENENQELENVALNSDELLKKSEAQQKEIERLKAELANERNKASVPMKTDKVRVKEAIEKALAEGKDPWKVKIPVRARPRHGTTEKHYWMGVNGRFLAVPADDKFYDLALPFAECLVNAMDAENFVKEYADKIQVYDLISNPHEEEMER